MMKRVIGITLAVLLAVSFSAFAGGAQESEGTITAYTTLDEELARKVFNAFTEETGIQVDWVRLSTGECVARMEAEKENPQASIWYGGVGLGHIEAKNKGLTMKYESPAWTSEDKFRDADRFWSGIYAGPLCFESNTQSLEKFDLEAPTSWEDLTDPKYEGHIQMANPGSSGTAYNVLATIVNLKGEDEGFKYMQQLDRNITQYTRSGSAPGKNAAIGETTVAIGYAHDGVKLVDQGYPLEITFPSEGTGYEIASVSLIKNGPEGELENAKKLYDWALGETAAKIYTSAFVVPFVDVPLPEGAVPISEVNTIDQEDEWAAANKTRLVEKWNDVVGGEAKTEPEN